MYVNLKFWHILQSINVSFKEINTSLFSMRNLFHQICSRPWINVIDWAPFHKSLLLPGNNVNIFIDCYDVHSQYREILNILQTAIYHIFVFEKIVVVINFVMWRSTITLSLNTEKNGDILLTEFIRGLVWTMWESTGNRPPILQISRSCRYGANLM